jgi:hypothetical protein
MEAIVPDVNKKAMRSGRVPAAWLSRVGAISSTVSRVAATTPEQIVRKPVIFCLVTANQERAEIRDGSKFIFLAHVPNR